MQAPSKQTGGPPVTAAASQIGSDQRQYLTFLLGNETFSIDILSIREIIWYTAPTEVPMMPECILGVINLRGSVVPVMDLCNRFGRPTTPVSKSTCIVIVEVDAATGGGRLNVGVVVDAVHAVVEIPPTEIEPAPSFGAKIRRDFISGIGKVGGKFVILLDVGQVLSVSEVSALGEMVAAEPETAKA